jgi:5-methylcytosine-specific restriction endonuclease McrA
VTRVRDYKHEYDSYHAKPEQKKKRAMRNAARRDFEATGRVSKGDGKDVDHKKPLRNGGTNSASNLRVTTQSNNRAWRKGKS